MAPHKPVLLISVLQAVQAGIIKENKILINADLIALFKTNWNLLVETDHFCKLALPYFHLRSAVFWQLKAKAGYELILQKLVSISSISQLDSMVEYAVLDNDLFALMQDDDSNLVLKNTLLQTYFNQQKCEFGTTIANSSTLIDAVSDKILNEPPEVYQKEIEVLLSQEDDEEIFLRGSVFKKQIPRIYNNSCCISGLRIDSKLSLSMIDACHIRPFSDSHDDTITNGISLCPNLHRAFDRGIVSISNEYRVIVSPSFTEDNNVYGIRQFENKPILLPEKAAHRPAISNLEWHQENCFVAR